MVVVEKSGSAARVGQACLPAYLPIFGNQTPHRNGSDGVCFYRSGLVYVLSSCPFEMATVAPPRNRQHRVVWKLNSPSLSAHTTHR